MEFTYDGMVRYGFGFDNPNHAAALFAMLIPWIWQLHRRPNNPRWLQWGCMVGELSLVSALVATCSRSGLLAMIAAGVVFSAALWRRPGIQLKLPWRRILLWAGGIGMLLVVIPLGRSLLQRCLNGIITPDASITHRLKLWHGAMSLLADNPQGVGAGNSGYIYTVTSAQSDGFTGYRTMVNSFLTLAVEQGLFVAVMVLGIILAAGITGIQILHRSRRTSPPSEAGIILPALASLTAGVIGAVSSTCMDATLLAGEPTVNVILQTFILAFFVIVVIFILCHGVREVRGQLRIWTASFMVAGIIGLGMVGCGKGPGRVKIQADREGLLTMIVNSAAPTITIGMPAADMFEQNRILCDIRHYFPTRNIAFPLPGKTFIPKLPKPEDLIAVNSCNAVPPGYRGVIYHPEELPPDGIMQGNIVMLILDANDAKGVNSYWRSWAEKQKIPWQI